MIVRDFMPPAPLLEQLLNEMVLIDDHIYFIYIQKVYCIIDQVKVNCICSFYYVQADSSPGLLQ